MRRAALQRRPRSPEPALRSAFGVPVGAPGDAHEREAEQVADMISTGRPLPTTPFAPRGLGAQRKAASIRPLSAAPALRLAKEPGAPLSKGERGFFEPRFGRGLGGVRVHHWPSSEALSRQIDARAFTIGNDIFFAPGEYAPQTHRGRHLLAHELTHTLQPAGHERLHRKTLTDIPDATRTKLRVSRLAPPQADVDGWIANYFNPKSGARAAPRARMEFGNEITDANQQAGFRGIAYHLEHMSEVDTTPATATEPAKKTNTDPTMWPLPPGTILDFALDLRPQGGEHAIFRFIHYVDGRDTRILVERIHVLAPATAAAGAAGPTQAPATQAQPQVATGDVTVGSVKIKIDSSFGNDRGQQIVNAVRLLPDPIRAKVDGVTFSFMGGTKGPDGRAGDYQEDKDTVRVYGDMFTASPHRIGKGTQPQYSIVHELGHAIDRRPLFAAQRARGKAEETKKKLETQLKHPPIDINNVDPLGDLSSEKSPARLAEEKRLKDAIAAAQTDIDAQNAAMAKAKSVAGDELGNSNPSEQLLTEFGKALEADGVKVVKDARKTNRKIEAENKQAATENAADPTGPRKAMKPAIKTLAGGVTDYAATNLMEAFAENFSIYILDEALLKAIRPKTHTFFAKAFPKAVAPPPAAKP